MEKRQNLREIVASNRLKKAPTMLVLTKYPEVHRPYLVPNDVAIIYVHRPPYRIMFSGWTLDGTSVDICFIRDLRSPGITVVYENKVPKGSVEWFVSTLEERYNFTFIPVFVDKLTHEIAMRAHLDLKGGQVL